jgi:hypothetical protein
LDDEYGQMKVPLDRYEETFERRKKEKTTKFEHFTKVNRENC